MLVEKSSYHLVDRCVAKVLNTSAHQPVASRNAHPDGCGRCRHAISLQAELQIVYTTAKPANDAFSQFLADKTYNANQMHFLGLLVDVLARN
jgi:hypothetical protein